MFGIELTIFNTVPLIFILYQQLYRKDIIKILSSGIFFWICYELYEFNTEFVNITILGHIVLFLFYQSIETIDRLILSNITYHIVGILLNGKEVAKNIYTIVHWLIVRLILLYVWILPSLDSILWIILFAILGGAIFIIDIFSKFNLSKSFQ